MELPVRIEQPVHRVATRSSTKRRELERRARKDRRRTRARKVGEPDDSSSDSSFNPEMVREPDQVTPIAAVEKGVEENRIPRDINREVREDLANPELTPKWVRFDDSPVIIQPDLKPNEYDIIHDIKEQKANATIGQLLHDNPNYQKLVREEWPKKRRQKFRLPAVAVNFAQVEDYRAPELVVEVDGCTIPKVPVDRGSGVNLMLESTALDLGYTTFEETDQILRMADQSRVVPAGRLSQIPTWIGQVTYLQNFVIIRVGTGRPFPMLLGRPWLYSAKVLVDWGAKEFIVGKLPMRIPWKAEKYLGETSDLDGYTSGWTDPEESDSIPSYLVAQFQEQPKLTLVLYFWFKRRATWKKWKGINRNQQTSRTNPWGKPTSHLHPTGSATGLGKDSYQQTNLEKNYHGARSGWNQKKVIWDESKASSTPQTTPKWKPNKGGPSISPIR